MRVVINTPHGRHIVHSASEAQDIIYEYIPDGEKARNLANSIFDLAQHRPDDAPPLEINLNKEN